MRGTHTVFVIHSLSSGKDRLIECWLIPIWITRACSSLIGNLSLGYVYNMLKPAEKPHHTINFIPYIRIEINTIDQGHNVAEVICNLLFFIHTE